MKYISYFLMMITSVFLVILLSLSSCDPNQTTAVQPTMNYPQPHEQPQRLQTTISQAALSPASQPANATVKIHNFKFEPANLSIAVGKTVQFVNVDEEPHTATATDGTFNSKALDTEQTWNYTATKPGTYPYICSIHPFMKGTLTVTL